jgi:hypothetical protein
MPSPEYYREKAEEFADLAKRANAPNELREFLRQEQSFTRLADNEQWLTDNPDKLAHNLEKLVPLPEPSGINEATLAAEEDQILRYLGVALIMQWNTLPTELQKTLFDNAGSMGELENDTLRGQIARFLRKQTGRHRLSVKSRPISSTTSPPTAPASPPCSREPS